MDIFGKTKISIFLNWHQDVSGGSPDLGSGRNRAVPHFAATCTASKICEWVSRSVWLHPGILENAVDISEKSQILDNYFAFSRKSQQFEIDTTVCSTDFPNCTK